MSSELEYRRPGFGVSANRIVIDLGPRTIFLIMQHAALFRVLVGRVRHAESGKTPAEGSRPMGVRRRVSSNPVECVFRAIVIADFAAS